MPMCFVVLLYVARRLRCQYGIVSCRFSLILLSGRCVSLWPEGASCVRCVVIVVFSRFALFFAVRGEEVLLVLFLRCLLTLEQLSKAFWIATAGCVMA